MRKLLLSLALVGTLAAPAVAQGVNTVPQVGMISAILKQNTYSAVSIGLVPAASATDVFCISGSSTKAISIKRIAVSGTAGTLVTLPVTLLRRTTLDTGGTAATTTALPVAASNQTSQPAATATLTAYTANPTINDASPTYFGTRTVSLNTTAALANGPPIIWTFGEQVSTFSHAPNLLAGSTTQQYCINLNAISVTTGVMNIEITWIEG